MLKESKLKISAYVLSLLFLIPMQISVPQGKELKKVSFLPLWFPQEQFAGYYMAYEKGIYKKRGLDVNIIPGGDMHNVVADLTGGVADLGVLFLYTGLMERAKGTKIVNIGQIFQRSSIMFVAKKKSGIKTLSDFNGKRIGIWNSVAKELTTGFLSNHKINASIIYFDKGINLLLDDAVDIMVVMNYNEYKRLINAGLRPEEINKFYFYDYEMNFPEDGIYCAEEFYKLNSEACRRFVEASIEGWDYALANKEETISVIGRYKKLANVSFNKAHARWMLNCMDDMIKSSNKKVKPGVLLAQDFNFLGNFLYANKFIEKIPSYEDFYKGGK